MDRAAGRAADTCDLVWVIIGVGDDRLLRGTVTRTREELTWHAAAHGCLLLCGIDDDPDDDGRPYAAWWVATPGPPALLREVLDQGADVDPPAAVGQVVAFLDAASPGVRWSVELDRLQTLHRYVEHELRRSHSGLIDAVERRVLPLRDDAVTAGVLDEHIHVWAVGRSGAIGTYRLPLWELPTGEHVALDLGLLAPEAFDRHELAEQALDLAGAPDVPVLVDPLPSEPTFYGRIELPDGLHHVYGHDLDRFVDELSALVERRRPARSTG